MVAQGERVRDEDERGELRVGVAARAPVADLGAAELQEAGERPAVELKFVGAAQVELAEEAAAPCREEVDAVRLQGEQVIRRRVGRVAQDLDRPIVERLGPGYPPGEIAAGGAGGGADGGGEGGGSGGGGGGGGIVSRRSAARRGSSASRRG